MDNFQLLAATDFAAYILRPFAFGQTLEKELKALRCWSAREICH